VSIGEGAVVRNSVIAPGLTIPPGAVLENRLIENELQLFKSKPEINLDIFHGPKQSRLLMSDTYGHHRFKTWSPFSYARFWKRLFDIVTALVVLTLFLPAAPFVAIAIKLTSNGPVLFKDRRQGLHGRNFYCLKFRTMISDASGLQDHLRQLNQVDGPQFSIKDDPRTNSVGRFLRETFIDEIPQFINVLLGQMSVVGPRPSPESENTQCPRWREVCRTRAWGRDFQEWIKFDMMYVRKLSFGMDLWICWRTARKIFVGFVKQLKK
jgi:lipopolysaccharide/colanic/teichoic acid biosynthesis glycosyltransferase